MLMLRREAMRAHLQSMRVPSQRKLRTLPHSNRRDLCEDSYDKGDNQARGQDAADRHEHVA
jgi:hypothetical protein